MTEKISVTIQRNELRDAKRLASRLGLSLSAFITNAVRGEIERQARKEAGLGVLATFDPEDRASPAEMRELLSEWATPGRNRTQSGKTKLQRAARSKKKRS